MNSESPSRDVLLVEDDPLLAATTQRGLERLSLPVRVAETCAQANEIWDASYPLVVLMDYRLPDGFGTDAIARMRSRGRDEPVICMTAESEVLSPDICRSLNIARILPKPVLPAAIAAALDGVLSLPSRIQRGHRESRRVGRFRIVRCGATLSAPNIIRLSRAAGERDWLALDVASLRALDEHAARALCAWGAWLSSHGGRLCLLVDDCARQDWITQRVGFAVDVLRGREQLATQGLRLTGLGERQELIALNDPREV